MQYKTGFVPEDLASTNVDTVASFKYIFNFPFIHIFVMHQFLFNNWDYKIKEERVGFVWHDVLKTLKSLIFSNIILDLWIC